MLNECLEQNVCRDKSKEIDSHSKLTLLLSLYYAIKLIQGLYNYLAKLV